MVIIVEIIDVIKLLEDNEGCDRNVEYNLDCTNYEFGLLLLSLIVCIMFVHYGLGKYLRCYKVLSSKGPVYQ